MKRISQRSRVLYERLDEEETLPVDEELTCSIAGNRIWCAREERDRTLPHQQSLPASERSPRLITNPNTLNSFNEREKKNTHAELQSIPEDQPERVQEDVHREKNEDRHVQGVRMNVEIPFIGLSPNIDDGVNEKG